MGIEWISFPALLAACWVALLLPLTLRGLWRFDPRRLGTALPLLLLAGCVYQHQPLLRLAARCETALLSLPGAEFLVRSFDLPLS